MRGFSLWKALESCGKISTYLAVISTLILTCLTTFDAAGRYLFNHPILGAYEITEQYLMVAAVFLGIFYAYREGAYIRVTFLVERLPGKVKIGLNYFIQLLTSLLTFGFLIATIKQALRVFSRHETLQVFEVPIWPAYAIVILGLFLTFIGMLVDLQHVRTGQSSLFKEDSPGSEST
jgi:TRAP-type C4-dicarboxylate transport system permease small subunit